MGIQGEAWEKAGLLKEDLGRMGESGQGLLDRGKPSPLSKDQCQTPSPVSF